MHVNFSKFKETRVHTQDVTAEEHEGFGFEDQYDAGTEGYLYNAGNLFIERISEEQYHVELFGGDYFGSLEDCEAELWYAASCEGCLDQCEPKKVPRITIRLNDTGEYYVPAGDGEIYYTEDEDDAISTAKDMHGNDAEIVIRPGTEADIDRAAN
jgi:hypothetical protein